MNILGDGQERCVYSCSNRIDFSYGIQICKVEIGLFVQYFKYVDFFKFDVKGLKWRCKKGRVRKAKSNEGDIGVQNIC